METLRRILSRRVPSFVVVDMPTDSSCPFNIDKEKLKKLAKNKNQDILRELGGVDGITLSLKTHASFGIRGDAADLRNRINFLESKSYRTIGIVYRYLLTMSRSFKEFSFLFLCACSVYLIIVGIMSEGNNGWQDGTYSFVFSFMFSVISSTIGKGVGAYFDKAIRGSQLIIVLRNGLKQQIPVSSILVGDIALLKQGDKIPADGLFLEAYGDQPLKLDESDLTDEGKVVEINYSDPFLSAGAKVVERQAKMMVTSTDVRENFSGICGITELGAQINYLIRLLEIMKRVLAMSSLLISLSRYFSGTAKDDNGYRLFCHGRTSALEVSYMTVEYITAASVIFVAMDTTNFSWALKICFAHSINEMAACNVIVRNLLSWEKIGLSGATINVSDGFNASNQLITSNFLFVPQITDNKKTSSRISSDVLQLIQQGIGLNTVGISNHAQWKCKLKFLGSPSERAFFSQAALVSNMDWEKLINDCAIVKVENLENQGRLILVKKDDSFLEHRRGLAEMILPMCSGYYDNRGILHSLNEDTRSLLDQKLQSMNCDSRTRVIALPYRQVPSQELKDDSNLEENEDCCNLLGFVVLKEVNQDETVQDVVQKCCNPGMDFNRFHKRNLDSGVAGAAVTEPGEMGIDQGQENELLAPGMTTGETDVTECECGNDSKGTMENCTELAKSQKNFGSVEQCGAFQEVEQKRQEENLDNGMEATELGETESNEDKKDIIQSEEESNESEKDTECSKEVVSVSGSNDGIVLEQIHDTTDLASVEEEVAALSKATVSQNNFVSVEQCRAFQEVEQKRQEENLDNGTEATELGETESNEDKKDIIQSEEESNESEKDTECTKEVASVSGSNDGIVLEQIHHATDLANVGEEVAAQSEATVSISKGIPGDETTRTSDIVILDGKITTLPLILMWAKCMLINTQAFTQFQLTVMISNIANAFISLVGPLKTSGVNKELAFQLVQQIWVNTVMGLIGTLTFGRQRPQPSITELQKPPEEEKIWLITGYMLRNILIQSAYQIIVVSVLQFKPTTFGFTDRARDTTTFVLPIFFQVLNMISARKIEEKNIFSGIQPRFIWLIATLMLATFVLVEILVRIVYFESLDEKQWAVRTTIALVSWPVGFAAKFVPVGFFSMPVRFVAAPIMAVVYRLEELGNWIKSTASKLAFW